MIHGYSDHAANERTYLAWVRTGIAVIAFGFVVEKFNLFMRSLASVAADKAAAHLRAARPRRGPGTDRRRRRVDRGRHIALCPHDAAPRRPRTAFCHQRPP